MQYSQYCRGPAAKAGRAEHEISRPERFPRRKYKVHEGFLPSNSAAGKNAALFFLFEELCPVFEGGASRVPLEQP